MKPGLGTVDVEEKEKRNEETLYIEEELARLGNGKRGCEVRSYCVVITY